MRRAADILHSHLFACTTSIGECVIRSHGDVSQVAHDLDGVWGRRGHRVQLIVNNDNRLEGVHFLEI